jgi:RNA polymerase sigma-32 factor
MLRFILNNLRLVKVGTTHAQRKLFFNLNREKDKLEKLGIAPEHQLLAERLEVKQDEVAEMERRLGGSEVSLDATFGRDDDERTRLDTLADDADGPDLRFERAEYDDRLRAILDEFTAGLSGREKTLFQTRWLSEDPATLQEVGDQFGISRERTRQIEKRLLRRLRAVLEARLGSAVSLTALNPADSQP